MAAIKDPARKCPKMNIAAMRKVLAMNLVAEGALMKKMDQRSELMNKRKMSRYVKDGSGRCHVLRVSGDLALLWSCQIVCDEECF